MLNILALIINVDIQVNVTSFSNYSSGAILIIYKWTTTISLYFFNNIDFIICHSVITNCLTKMDVYLFNTIFRLSNYGSSILRNDFDVIVIKVQVNLLTINFVFNNLFWLARFFTKVDIYIFSWLDYSLLLFSRDLFKWWILSLLFNIYFSSWISFSIIFFFKVNENSFTILTPYLNGSIILRNYFYWFI